MDHTDKEYLKEQVYLEEGWRPARLLNARATDPNLIHTFRLVVQELKTHLPDNSYSHEGFEKLVKYVEANPGKLDLVSSKWAA